MNTVGFPPEGVCPQTDIQDAEYMHDPTLSAQIHFQAQCKGIIDNNPCLMIMDTGAAGSVVSMSYLSKVDPSWESKISGEGSGLWRGYGSDLTPKGIYTTGVVFCHPRGDIRCKMSFTVMADENLPSYFIVGIDNIRLYGIKLNVCNEFFTIGRNLKEKKIKSNVRRL